MEGFDPKLREVVCNILVEENGKKEKSSGFYISQKHILTTARVLWRTHRPKITTRRLANSKILDAKVYYKDESLNLAMLELIEQPPDESFGTLVTGDATLHMNDKVFTFVSALGFEATFLHGYVGYFCPDSFARDSILCRDFIDEEAETDTPEFWSPRKMCHYWNDSSSYNAFEGAVQADITIIPCVDLDFDDSCEGSPLFKLNGEIVGMFVQQPNYLDDNSFPPQHKIAIHVSAIREFVKGAQNE